MLRPVCVACNREMRCELNGALVRTSIGMARAGDMYRCWRCGCAVVVGFAKDLDVRLPLEFTNSESGDHTPVTRPLEKALVGSSIGRPNASSEPVGEFRGGVAIVIDGLKTPITAADAAERIRRMRSQPDWSSTAKTWRPALS